MTYKRSKTDSALYCPYCGRNFAMNTDRYYATYKARETGGRWAFAITECKSCKHEFYFRNITPATVRKYGINAVMKIEETEKDRKIMGKEQIKEEMCDNYCKWPKEYDEWIDEIIETQGLEKRPGDRIPLEESDICRNCPLNRL